MREKSISIIVPVFNERAALPQLLDQLAPLAQDAEVIVVDGGSTDGTPELLPPEVRLVRAKKGRGVQLNAGAEASTGEVLLFLHADCLLPPDALCEIQRVMRTHRVGAFGIRFDTPSLLMRCCAVLSNFRCYVRRIPFGDQGVFLERELFFEMGMFAPIPVMEDFRFALDLRSRGLAPGKTSQRLVTSARRFGISPIDQLRTMHMMARFRKRFLRGEDAGALAREYADIRSASTR